MRLDDMGFPSITEARASSASQYSPLQRCELIITDACNLKCTYCNGLSQEYGRAITDERANKLIDGWICHNLQHASFSGGEPMCSPSIAKHVDKLHRSGVPFVSLSTNGTFPVKDYEKLVKLGATHFAISIDGMNADTADKMAGVPGAWAKVVESIRFLSKCSYVTASTVFNTDNLEQAPAIIEFIHSLGVADIRFSTATQYNKLIPFLEKIPKEIIEAHPILKFRVANIIAGKSMRGNNHNKRCWLPLDDMVVSNKYHFPCTMQLREGGQPIGKIISQELFGKSMSDIRAERALWCKNHDCQSDNICKKYCMDFIIAYNEKVNKRHEI